jgi:hypothetical protein
MAGRKSGRKQAASKKKVKGRGGGLRGVRGRGDYQVTAPAADNRVGLFAKLDKALRRIPRGSFASKGSAFGAKYGGALGAGIGRVAGSGMAAISGYGNYTVNSNSVSRVSSSMDMVPQFVKKEHSVRIRHREFIRDLVVPGTGTLFNLQDYVINPGNRELFPWLGQMARQYSQYKIHGMVFAFKSMSSDYAASGPLGTVVMATNYNAIDRVFANKIEMENSEFAVSCKPSMSLVHAIECDSKVSGVDVLYIRDPGYETAEVSDRRFYDYGRFQVATSGLPGNAASTLGELWVTYDIELMKPVIGGIYTTGVALVSNPDGTVAVTDSAAVQAITYTAPLLTPSLSTQTPVVPPTYVITGDAGIDGNTVALVGGAFTFKKNGRYRVILSGKGTVGSSANFLGSGSLNNDVNITTARFGNCWYNAVDAVGTPSDPEITGQSFVPHEYSSFASVDVGLYRFVADFTVSGIATTGDYLVVNYGTFPTHNATLVPFIRAARVEWYATGTNQQTESYLATANNDY